MNPTLVRALLDSYLTDGGINHFDGVTLPSHGSVRQLALDFLRLLFPGYYTDESLAGPKLVSYVDGLLDNIVSRLETEIEKCLVFARVEEAGKVARADTLDVLQQVPRIRKLVNADTLAAFQGDPAASSVEEVILAYPCTIAISLQRIAHVLYQLRVPLLPRMLTEHAHSQTGCDIHPGAQLGTNFFVDHCTGVVIGETAIIGNHVKIYQGVTLGAHSFALDDAGLPIKGVKRHPNIGDNVTIYANATVLGGATHVGHDSIIGSNVWLMESVPAYSMVTGGSEAKVKLRRLREAS